LLLLSSVKQSPASSKAPLNKIALHAAWSLRGTKQGRLEHPLQPEAISVEGEREALPKISLTQYQLWCQEQAMFFAALVSTLNSSYLQISLDL